LRLCVRDLGQADFRTRSGRETLDKSDRDAQVDAVVALAMAVERAQHREEPVRLLGWI
jgi:hypothetical protein